MNEKWVRVSFTKTILDGIIDWKETCKKLMIFKICKIELGAFPDPTTTLATYFRKENPFFGDSKAQAMLFL